jgi:hypothetical protein
LAPGASLSKPGTRFEDPLTANAAARRAPVGLPSHNPHNPAASWCLARCRKLIPRERRRDAPNSRHSRHLRRCG